MCVLIDILLPTCNGQRFIGEMLASVQRQTVADWRLLIRDDGSDDATREHLAAFARVDSRASVAEGSMSASLRAWTPCCARQPPPTSCRRIRTISGARTRSPCCWRPCAGWRNGTGRNARCSFIPTRS